MQSMDCLRLYTYVLVACVFVMTVKGDAGPDLEYFMKAVCKDPDEPYKCSPSAICYGYESYCHSEDQVESCFPSEISDNETAIWNWCQQNEHSLSTLPHPECKFACVSKFPSRYVILTSDKGPDQEYFTKAVCKDPDKPYKCSPSAVCYGNESYCHSEDRVESCFPSEISDNETAIWNWCQQNEHSLSTLPHPECKFACVSKFRSRYLSLTSDKITQPTVNTFTVSSDQDTKSSNCQGNASDNNVTVTVLAICLTVCIIIILLGFGLLVLLFYRGQISLQKPERDAEIQGGNHLPRHNRMESVNEKSTDPLTVDNLETDRNVNQPALNDRNLPSRIQVHHVQGTRNTQNRSSGNQFDHIQGTRTGNTQKEETRYCRHTRVSATSSPSLSLRRDNDASSEKSLPLIPRNRATESDDNISPGQSETDLSIHNSATATEAAS